MPKKKNENPIKNKNAFYDRERIDFRDLKYEKLSDGIYILGNKYSQYNDKKYTKEQLEKLLEAKDINGLKKASNYFFDVSGEYRRLILYFSYLLLFDYLIVPKFNKPEQVSEEKFKKAYKNVLDYTDECYIKEVGRFVSFIAVKDGTFYGYEWDIDGKTIIQQLPYEYCRSVTKDMNGNYLIDFDLTFFNGFKDLNSKLTILEQFPEEIQNAYFAYNKGTIKDKWYTINSQYGRCHKLFDNGMPLFAHLLPKVVNLETYEELDRVGSKMDLYKLIVQKVPFNEKENLPSVDIEEMRELHKAVKNMLNQEGVDVLTTFADVESVNLGSDRDSKQDIITKATNSLYSASGTSQSLFHNKESGNIGLNKSVKTDESIMFTLLDQFKRWYEFKVNKHLITSRNYNFEFNFLPTTIFNVEDYLKSAKEMATLGYSKLIPAIVSGTKQSTFMNLMTLENDFLGLDKVMKPLSTSYTQNDNGRPKGKEDNLDDNTMLQNDKDK